MEGDVEPLEMPEHPAAQLQQHPLADAPRPVEEEQPAAACTAATPASIATMTINSRAEPPASSGGTP